MAHEGMIKGLSYEIKGWKSDVILNSVKRNYVSHRNPELLDSNPTDSETTELSDFSEPVLR